MFGICFLQMTLYDCFFSHNFSFQVEVSSKLGEISTDFEMKQRKSARIVGIDHFQPGETALHLVSASNVL